MADRRWLVCGVLCGLVVAAGWAYAGTVRIAAAGLSEYGLSEDAIDEVVGEYDCTFLLRCAGSARSEPRAVSRLPSLDAIRDPASEVRSGTT